MVQVRRERRQVEQRRERSDTFSRRRGWLSYRTQLGTVLIYNVSMDTQQLQQLHLREKRKVYWYYYHLHGSHRIGRYMKHIYEFVAPGRHVIPIVIANGWENSYGSHWAIYYSSHPIYNTFSDVTRMDTDTTISNQHYYYSTLLLLINKLLLWMMVKLLSFEDGMTPERKVDTMLSVPTGYHHTV